LKCISYAITPSIRIFTLLKSLVYVRMSVCGVTLLQARQALETGEMQGHWAKSPAHRGTMGPRGHRPSKELYWPIFLQYLNKCVNSTDAFIDNDYTHVNFIITHRYYLQNNLQHNNVMDVIFHKTILTSNFIPQTFLASSYL